MARWHSRSPSLDSSGSIKAAGSDEATTRDLRLSLEKLKPGQNVRVLHTLRGEIEARFAGVIRDSLALTLSDRPQHKADTMALTDVTSVWKGRRYTAWGALAGAAIGAGLGALSGDEECGSGFEGIGNCVSAGQKAAVGALIGSILGLVVGHEIHTYSRIYP